MEPHSYVKGSCGRDFAVFFASADKKWRFMNEVCRVDNSNERGDNIFTDKQEIQRRNKRL